MASVVWRQVEETGAWVAHTRSTRVKGVCHFLGGAFAGAAPQVLYNLYAELIAEAGYTVLATPYQVTFKHLDCACQVRASFLDTVQQLRSQGRGYLVPANAPTYGVGHSNGALLHLLIGALFDQPVKSNVVISFNNLQVNDAIPIPGFLAGLQPTVQAARAAPAPQLPLPTPDQVLAGVSAALPPVLLQNRQLLASATPFVQQLGSVVGEVGDGITDFTPSPEESRQLIGSRYSVASTLMVRFADDSIDQTPEMVRILQHRPTAAAGSTLTATAGSSGQTGAGGSVGSDDGSNGSIAVLEEQRLTAPTQRVVQELVLPGSHVTPCGSDLAWEAGPVFSPVDALAQGFKTGTQTDVRRLAERTVEWLDAQR